jgi:hypothetical protein
MFLFLNLKYVLNFLIINFTKVLNVFWNKTLTKINFIPQYYTRNENIWMDGFLFDFLQKKTADAWVRQFVIYTGFLFSERLVFDVIVRLYLDNIIWPAHNNSIFETSNFNEMLLSVLFLYITLFLLFFSTYIIFLI